MTSRHGPIYEVTFFVDHDVVANCDEWLEEHVRTSLRLAVVADCRVFQLPDDEHGRARRICQHILETDEALDEFVDGAGADIETDVTATFGERVIVMDRVLREDETYTAPAGEPPDCLNCGTRLRGQYCGNCGQRSRSRLISLWELISDAFGDLFELDSRLWRTLVPLMIRPGRLTQDYLQGRRARYMPPFRMYLVMSLIFFVVAFFDPRGELSLVTENEPDPGASAGDSTELSETAPRVPSETEQARQEIFDELAREGIIVGGGTQAEGFDDERSFHFQFGTDTDVVVSPNEDTGDCDVDASDLEDIPEWIAWLVTPERIQHVCERIMVDDGRAFAREILDNVPAALIVLLPLMAFVLKVLYPLSRRYYVEHLLFFVHYHAYFFLILTLQILFARIAALLRIPESVIALTIVAVSLYIPIYLFVAMRKVYGQGRFVTFIKYIVLTIAYLAGFTVTMLGALAIAALSI
ncbi:MAG: DUF4286 family protein [Gammaproteobacteria bacterium]|nr:DUF4286 family protein [Gammaproteobacteria bacterium]